MSSQNITWILCLSTLLSDFGTWLSKWTTKWKHWTTVQLFFSLTQARCSSSIGSRVVWHQKCNTVAHFLDMSVFGGSWCISSNLCSHLMKHLNFLNPLCLKILPSLSLSFSHLCTFFLTISPFSLPGNFQWIDFDGEFSKQPNLTAISSVALVEKSQGVSAGKLSSQQSSSWLWLCVKKEICNIHAAWIVVESNLKWNIQIFQDVFLYFWAASHIYQN